MNRTDDFWAGVVNHCQSNGIPQGRIAQLRSLALVGPRNAQKSPFAGAIASAARSIADLRAFIREHQQGYLSSSYSRAEKERIEAEVGLFVKTCARQIDQLKESVLAAQRAEDGHQRPLYSGQAIAHLHGVVLQLAEKLHAVSSRFDRFRAERYQQIVAEEERQRLQPTGASSSNSSTEQSTRGLSHGWSGLFRQKQGPDKADGKHAPALAYSSTDTAAVDAQASSAFTGEQQQQQLLQEANMSLVAQLTSMNTKVLGVERTMREIATLNQMFSTAVLHQAAAIETIYEAAVEASGYISRGNEDLRQTVKINRSSQRYLFVLLLFSTLCLLLLDWMFS